MKQLKDDDLVEVYKKAKEFNIDKEFVELLEEEMKKRRIIKNKSEQKVLK